MPLKGQKENAVAYLSFWLYSPRSLVNLLVEPDMPSLNMYLTANDAASVILNGKVLLPLSRERAKEEVKNVPLLKGWNHVLVKVLQKGKGWSVCIHFKSDNAAFMKEIRSSLTN